VRYTPYMLLPDLWYRNSVFYNLDLETFQDSDGDGCGDFEGLSRRLDYLESLGVNALWLGPFQPSPNRDNGYDISDYYGVDSRHGSLGDFVEFLHEADSRGIRVVMDLVVNHTSDRHPWFRDARRSISSPFHDWYVWSKKRPPNWKSGMVFPGVQERTWTRAKEVGEYYFHRFYDFQPDLNMAHPEVREEVRRIMGFWLALGVAGFRLDAVPFILEKPSAGGRGQPLRFEYLEEMRRFVQWRVGDAVLLGEANVPPNESQTYFSERGGLHMMFNFWVNQHVFYALASADVRPLAKALQATRKLPATAQWAQFLRNHDELDLGRLTKEQQVAVFERFGPEEAMRLYGRGIRRRLAPMLGERRRLELAYSLMFSLPGTPVLYYGDEIGMGDNLALAERRTVRTPMQWSSDRNAGFSTADKLVSPVIAGGPYGYENVNVERQRRDPDSFLRWMTRMIRLRIECPEIGWGAWKLVATRSPYVLALLYRWRGSALLCVHNFDEQPHEVTLRLAGEDADRLVDLISEDHSQAGPGGTHRISLAAYGYRWYAVGRPEAGPQRRVSS
jgi:maltose alpha-D-glucosyltransferase / alpha-amylase